MINSAITAFLLLVLTGILLYRSSYDREGNPGFFDKDNTGAIRGFACVIVIFVHIPFNHLNPMQQLVGRFAYIAVTFFFMTSAYGLSLGIRRRPEKLRTFWRSRLPRLLIPLALVNVARFLAEGCLLQTGFEGKNLFRLDSWVGLLLVCYLIFWLAARLEKSRHSEALIVAGVMALSLLSYTLGRLDLFGAPWWPAELYGFVWGILLCRFFPAITQNGQKHWFAKLCALLVCALLLGVAYLRYKSVAFWGEYLLKIALGAALTAVILLVNLRLRIGNRLIGCLGSISYEVYLIHGLVIELLDWYLPGISSGSFLLLSVSLSIAAASAVHMISGPVEKWLYARPWFSRGS